jgi:hypothetical protein
MKRCRCGALFTHPKRDACNHCSGWACPAKGCGRAKTPEQETCGRPLCKRLHRATLPKPAEVLPMRKRRAI